MFQPSTFREDRVEVMHALISERPFATLVTMQEDGLCADHVPLVLHAEEGGPGRLRGHVAAKNPLSRCADPIDVLAVFQGPQRYISPAWYPSKQEHGKVVPTWNYAVVHARGRLRLQTDAAWLRAHLGALTDRSEAGRAKPWAVSDAPEDYVERQLRGLIGFEIEITALSGVWKVSQNKTDRDREGVLAGLGGEGTPEAAEMARLVASRARPPAGLGGPKAAG
ncbi:FMN-binding negative transcriptional regulator [Salinarimonas sp.]|uniref:FMN-binding negative transcriptional regulator n=1 Tax=Salinarimonas sp. TaxID=2766526 RepID=UPI0032D92AAD